MSRVSSETSAEYVARVVASGSVNAGPIGELAALYREARFSRHDLGDEHRARAFASLERALAAAKPHRRLATEHELMHLAAAEAWLAHKPLLAAHLYSNIVAKDPFDLLALRLAQSCWFFLGRRAKLHAVAERALAAWSPLRPGHDIVLAMTAFGCDEAGDAARAELAFDRALELDPKHVKAWLNSARLLLDLGRSHEALERIETAIGHDSTSGDALRLLARAQAKLGRTDEAFEAYRRALVLDDRDAWAMNNLGLLHLEQGNAEAALPPLARAVQLRGTAPVFQNNLGIALERSGFPKAALAA